ncbi:MAG: hypothetical protein OIF58_16550 [Cohaesibacter sp.]|nr:hypothetical protein [Cohaesibacter sp.]
MKRTPVDLTDEAAEVADEGHTKQLTMLKPTPKLMSLPPEKKRKRVEEEEEKAPVDVEPEQPEPPERKLPETHPALAYDLLLSVLGLHSFASIFMLHLCANILES